MTTSPWIALGDFNVIRRSSEWIGGDKSWPAYLDEYNEFKVVDKAASASNFPDFEMVEGWVVTIEENSVS